MTKREYLDLSFDELMHHQKFIEEVKSLSSEKEWERFLSEHTENSGNIRRAKELIDAFKVNDRRLDERLKMHLWDKITKYGSETDVSSTRSIRPILLQVAASIIFVISLGGAFYYFSESGKYKYEFSESAITEESTNSMLVLSTGEKVELKETQSTIAVLDKKETIQIENDTIVPNADKKELIKKEEIRLTEIIVPFGKKTKLTLNDGTKVWLNAGSRLAFPQKFHHKHRTVFLDGEGYFEVAENKDKPFIVSSENLNIEVLGTKFNVSSYTTDDYCQTALLEGSVKVWGRNKLLNEKVIMTPNQIATYNLEHKEMVLGTDKYPERYIAWVNGWYEFSNEDLLKVFTKLERYYDVKIGYDQVTIANALPISGKLDLKESIDEVMVVLAKVAGVRYQIDDKNITVTF